MKFSEIEKALRDTHYDPQKAKDIVQGTTELVRHELETAGGHASELRTAGLEEFFKAVDKVTPGERYQAEPGELTTVTPTYGVTDEGSPIIYINGIATSREMAIDEAQALSDSTGRRVELIYNHSASEADSLSGAIKHGVDGTLGTFKDLTGVDIPIVGEGTEWLMDAGEHLTLRTTPGGAGFDRLTNKLMTRIRERYADGDGDIVVVSQSGGNGDVKAAIEGFGKTGETDLLGSMTWYSTGTPLHSSEIPSGVRDLKAFEEIRDEADFVTNVLSGRDRLKGGTVDDHDFQTVYAGKVGDAYEKNKAEGFHQEDDTPEYEGGFDCFGTSGGSSRVPAEYIEPKGFAFSEVSGPAARRSVSDIDADPEHNPIAAALAETSGWGGTRSLDPEAAMTALRRDFSAAIGGSGVSGLGGGFEAPSSDAPDVGDFGLDDFDFGF